MYVVTLPASATSSPATFAENATNAGADILEIRTDLTPSIETFDSPLPLMVSLRGNNVNNLIESLKPQYVDIEGEQNMEIPSNSILIRSFHDYEKTPSLDELEVIAHNLSESGADILKIVTTINSYADLSILESLRESIPSAQKRVILGMGVKAHLSRMLSPFNNTLTYSYIEGEDAGATGQVPLQLHKLTGHCKEPKVFGILGSTDIQSGSPFIHNTLFHAHDIDAIFTTLLTDDLEDAWKYINENNIEGCAVTSPFKQGIIPLLDRLDDEAGSLGSVNTIVKENGKWLGYMRDTKGMMDGYRFLKGKKSAAILGSGGVVPAVIHVCRQSDIEEIRVFARNEEARNALEEQFSVKTSPLEAIEDYEPDVVICSINTDTFIPLPIAKEGAHAIDLRYNKKTQFLQDASQKGYAVCDGVPMLIHQALAQFTHFTNLTPSQKDLELLHTLYPSHYGE